MGEHLIIDGDLCIGCGRCQSVCIRRGILIVDGKAVENEDGSCFDCGHCFSVCPKGAIGLRRFPDADPAISGVTEMAGIEETMGLLRTLRSVRWFTDEPVTREELDILASAASYAPCAANARDVELVVVNDRLDEFKGMLADTFEDVRDVPRIVEFVEHHRSGAEGPDPFLWEGRQIMLAFAAEPLNATIAMGRVEIAAHSIGLGGFYSLWIQEAYRRDEGRFMSFFPDVGKGKRLGAAYVIGHPRIAFPRVPPRQTPVLRFCREGKMGPEGPVFHDLRRSA